MTTIASTVEQLFTRHGQVEHGPSEWLGIEGVIDDIAVQVCACRMSDGGCLVYVSTYAGRMSFNSGQGFAWILDGATGEIETITEPDTFVARHMERVLAMPDPVRLDDAQSFELITRFARPAGSTR